MTFPMQAPDPTLAAQGVLAGSAPMSSDATAGRIDLLNSSGHAWMPADMQTTLAAAPTTDSQLTQIADSIKNTLQNTWSGFTEAFHDPVLDKQPTTSLALARYLNASIGVIPIREDHLTTIQSNLQKYGFGKGLPVNGEWDGGWNAAYNDWLQRLRENQLAGDKPGSTSTHKVAHGFLSALIPSHAANALLGWVKSLPGDVRSMVADAASGIADIPHQLAHGDVSGLLLGPMGPAAVNRSQSGGASSVGAAVESLGRAKGSLTAAQYEQMHGAGRLLQDLGTLMTVVPIAGQLSAAGKVARGALADGLWTKTAEAASRGPGTIAQSLFGGRTAEQAAADTARRGLLNTKLFTNAPLLKQVGPAVGRLADADGLYYRARTLLAKPYQYGAVRVAGDAAQRGIMWGAGLRYAADIAHPLGLDNPLTTSITQSRPIDTADVAMHHLLGGPIEHPVSDAMDWLGMVLHGPLGSPATSVAVGDKVQAVTDAAGEALGRVGLHGVWEDATGHSTEALTKAFGGSEYLDRFITMKTADLAASHYAQKIAQQEGLGYGTPEFRQRVGDLADEVWANPDQHSDAIHSLLNPQNITEFTNRVKEDMVHGQMDPKAYAANAQAWMRSGDVLTRALRNGYGKFFFGGQGQALIENAKDAFDFGGDITPGDTLARTTGMTRRDYVKQVTRLQSRLTRQVGKLTDAADRDIVAQQSRLDAAKTARAEMDKAHPDYEAAKTEVRSATQSLRQAQARRDALDKALNVGTNGQSDIRKFVDTVNSPTPRIPKRMADQLINDHQRLRNLIEPAMGPDEKMLLGDIINRGLDPDNLYTRLNGPPRVVPDEIGSGDWFAEHLPNADGAIGVARLDSKTTQTALADMHRFEQALTAAGTDEEKYAQVVSQMRQYGFEHFGLDQRTLGLFDNRPDKLLDVLTERAHNLASDVFLTPDAPQELKDMVAEMAQHGYKPVLGSHIGHLWDGSLPDMPTVDGAVTGRRKIARALGLSPEQIDPRAAGKRARINILDAITRMTKDNRVVLPAQANAETVMSVLDARQTDLPHWSNVAMAITKPFHQQGIAQIMRTKNLDYQAARTEYEAEMGRALQLRDIPRRQFIKVMTQPKDIETAGGGTWHWDGVDEQTASLLYRAVLTGYRRGPGLMGAQALEDWARAGFSVLDKAAVAHPNSAWVQNIANAPNRVVQMRNQLRFTLSPYFDLRRIAKQNYKMSLEGVNPVLNPLKHMVDSGTFDDAHTYLTKLLGEHSTAAFDEADRYLHQQSVWGLYNSRHYEAYFAQQQKARGLTDDEVRASLHKVFDYGSSRTGGRSPFERTVNTVFFPFSFEKTLLRNTGAYMLDHPQQAMLAAGMVDAYERANRNGAVTQWTQDHLPILKDIQKLNAFAHGLSPGEFGGVNAPLLNLFLPQNWGKEFSKQNLQRMLPVFKDFGQVLKDAHEQYNIASAAMKNAWDYSTTLGAKRPFWDPYRPTITKSAQVRQAEKMRDSLITKFAPVLDYNRSHSNDADKIKWPMDPRLPSTVQGESVTRESLGYVAQNWFPAYNPADAAIYAEKQKQKAKQYLDGLKGTDKYAPYSYFITQANRLQGVLYRDTLDPQQAAQVFQAFRTAAANVASTDPAFYKFYDSHYRYLLGPLEQVTKP